MQRRAIVAAGRRVLRFGGSWAVRGLPDGAVWPTAVAASGFAARALEAWGVCHPWGQRLPEFLLAEALSALSHGGAHFPVPVYIDREDEFGALCRRHPRLLALSVHMPLNRFLHRRLREWGLSVRIVVRKYDGSAWGLGERLERIIQSPHVFLSIREALRRSSVVLIAIDGARGRDADGGYTAQLSSAALHFAHRTGTPVFVYRSLLTPDGAGRVLWEPGGDPGASFEEFSGAARAAFERVYAQPGDPRLQWQR